MNNDEQRWVPAVPDIDVPASHFSAAWELGRSRRRRRIASSGGASAALGIALLVGLAVVPGNGAGGDSLRQIGPAAPTTGAGSPAPSGAPTLPPHIGPSALPVLPGLPRTSPSPATDPSPQPHDEQQLEGEDAEASGQSGDSYAGSPSRPVERDYQSSSPQADANGTRGGGQTVCGLDVADRPSGQQARWCGSNDVTQERGDFLLKHRQCRAHDGDQSAMTFATSQEVEYEVATATGQLLWRWSDRVSVKPLQHELPTERGACYAWTTRWTPLDAEGRSLAAGTYRLRTWVNSHELGADAAYDHEFTIAAQEDEDEE